MPKVTCPKCSQEGWLIKKRLKGRWYLYVDHYSWGKHTVHYLGPARKFPDLAALVGLEVADNQVTSNASNHDSSDLESATNKLPAYEEFISRVEELARQGDEDAQKLLKRARKDGATIRRTLELLSRLS